MTGTGLRVVPLYEERYVLLAPEEQPMPQGHTMKWADAAQLPLALLTPDMRIRRVIDSAFAESGVAGDPASGDRLGRLAVRPGGCGSVGEHRAAHVVAGDAGGRPGKSHPTG